MANWDTVLVDRKPIRDKIGERSNEKLRFRVEWHRLWNEGEQVEKEMKGSLREGSYVWAQRKRGVQREMEIDHNPFRKPMTFEKTIRLL